ncbi:hypothetical protein [Candidatus Odyssella acanthamoebae]|uniref:EfeO-type cupredoxin-like domain-containing protein n=1 Tax=Candidatus Odyssella acanthamoebae TaxID=91604 RepID=A0A077AVC5_9PROT|nr:hypothetical protein [Candidatus Paracaedibacter acanthamoebae]AIK96351.1 hypothetical protein ID47_05790 [Candidatus Paracaedibacter acanthamoebae]
MMKLKLHYLILGILISTNSVLASTIHVTNHNKKPINIKIVAKEDKNAVTKMEIPAQQESTFTVDSEHLNGKSIYSIKGDTNPFTMGGKCEDLNVEKNYNVTFKNDKVGTSCVAELIK